MDIAPLPWIDHFVVLAKAGFIVVVTVAVSQYGPDHPALFADQTLQLVDPVTVLPAFIVYEGASSFYIGWKKPLGTGKAGWFLLFNFFFAALFYAITGGTGSVYFYPFAIVIIYTALSLKTVAAALCIMGIAAAHMIIGALLISAPTWDADVAHVAVGESIVLLVLGGIALFFTAQLRHDVRTYQTALVEARRSALLNEMSLRLTEHSLDLPRVIDTLLDAAHLLPHTEFAVILLLDPPDRQLHVAASTSDRHVVGDRAPDLAWPPDHHRMGGAGAGYPTPLPAYFVHDGAPQVVMVPLHLPSGDVLGGICCGRKTSQPCTPNEQMYLEDLASEAGLAVRNARLYARELDQVKRLRSFQELQTTYFSAIAHEMKTPLTVLRTLTPSLRQLPDLTDETRREILEAIDGNLARLEWSINGPLEGARLEAGVIVLHPRPLHLAASIRQVVARILPWLELKRQQVSVNAARDLPLVLADSSQIDHVITNLLVNAIKFAPPDSTIDVTLQLVGEVMQVYVEDKGPGVPPAERERVFDKFHSVAAAHASGGAGLGLYICRELVRQHGGRIWVEDRPGGGSRFCFTLPLADEDSADVESQLQDSGH